MTGPAARAMTQTLERIAARNSEVGAIVALRPADDLMAEAEAADRADPVGPLHGVPIAIKDLAQTKGIVTSFGSPLFADFVPEQDDPVPARLRAAGAILIGKTNTPEFGLGSHTVNPVYGATRNPYDRTRSAGGSSGGAAAALACGMLDMADGSDMMGSLRNPAAWNNVYGFRPSWGLVADAPEGDSYLHQLATLGPMAREPRFLARLLDAMVVSEPRVPFGRSERGFEAALDRPLPKLRVGWLSDWGGAYTMERGIADLCAVAAARMEGIGAVVQAVDPPFAAERIWQSWIDLRAFANAARLEPLYTDAAKRERLNTQAIWEIERGLGLSAMDVHRASAERSAWFRAAMALFETQDVLLLPSAQVWPFPIDWRFPQAIGEVQMDTYHRWMEVVVPVSLLGLPCVSLPVGFSADGLPMGMQAFAKPGADALLMQLAQAWHLETGGPEEWARGR